MYTDAPPSMLINGGLAKIIMTESVASHSSANSPFYRSTFFLSVVLPFLALLLYCVSFLPFIADDALISLRYAQRFLDGDGLTWTAGLPVEGYSNLSWVLIMSLLAYIGMDLIFATRLVAAVLYLSILYMNYCYWRPFLTQANRQFFYIAQYAFVFSSTTAIWLLGGLEQPLVAACIAWAVFFLLRDQQYREKAAQVHKKTSSLMGDIVSSFSWPIFITSLLLGVLCLTRPDSPIICVCLALALCLYNGFNRLSFFRCCVMGFFPVFFVLSQLAFRLHYYGEWVAMPAFIKVHPSLGSLTLGCIYVFAGILFLAPFSYYCFRILLVGRTSPHRFLITIAITTISIWLVYLCIIGGDIFPSFRHFTQILFLLSLIFPVIEHYFHQGQNSELPSYQFPVWKITVMAIFYIALQWANPSTSIARGHLWVWDGEVLAKAMKKGFGDAQPLMAVDAAGALPYWTGYPALDMLGLNDSHIAHAPPSKSSRFVGHQFGDGDYVYQQQPDLINFCFAHGWFTPCWKSGTELWKNPEFHKNYLPVRLSGETPYFVEGVQWIYKWSDAIGIKLENNTFTIPAYFFSLDAHIPNQSIKALWGNDVHANPVPEHLIRSYIAADDHWQIDVPINSLIYINQPFLGERDPLTAKIRFTPKGAEMTAKWTMSEDGQWLLALQPVGGQSLVLQKVEIIF